MALPDEAVVVASPEAFEVFYRREFRRVVAIAYALSGSRTGAEDLAQEAFIAAHRRWDEIGLYEKPEAWVRRVVSNLAVSAFRKKRSEAKALARLAARRQEVIPPLEAEHDDFWKLVRGLPKRQAQAVALHYLEDLPVSEIADILDCSPNTAKVHLHRGRKALAAKLAEEQP